MIEEMRTTDLWVAAYVMVRGGKFVKLEKNPARPAQAVVILSGENLKEIAQEYAVNSKIEIRSFKETFLSLKSRLFGRIQNTVFTKERTDERKTADTV